MAVPNVIGVYTRVAGVWERVNGDPGIAGTHTPFVRQGGTWYETDLIYGKVSAVWQVCHANIFYEISGDDYTLVDRDFDGPGYLARADFWVRSDGTIDGAGEGESAFQVAVWRDYDTGRDWELQLTESGTNWSSHPALAPTWLNLTDPSTDSTFYVSTNLVDKYSIMDCVFREKLSGEFSIGRGSRLIGDVQAGAL